VSSQTDLLAALSVATLRKEGCVVTVDMDKVPLMSCEPSTGESRTDRLALWTREITRSGMLRGCVEERARSRGVVVYCQSFSQKPKHTLQLYKRSIILVLIKTLL
jgi:hypothetical protein